MRFPLIAAGLVAALAACETNETETDDATGMAVDTLITERTVRDTAVVTTDTTVTVDTSVVRGEGNAAAQDTVVDTREGAQQQWTPADSAAAPADSQRLQRQTTPQTTP
ncbi:MAG: hypothetical protein M3Y31_11065 [Gemmatimonadota bacterium]|nr:hypothetical protein [Gemmatimonadota bacterium]